ncbi:Acid sphingomyelinase-like phosphodiesterase 3b, partial [Blyttiomyces sp. JEL0837]
YLPGSDVKQLCHRINTTDPTRNFAFKFGTLGSQCDTPFSLLDSVFDFIKTNDATKDADFVIYTGDTSRHDRDLVRPRTVEMILSDHQTVATYIENAYDLSRTCVFPTIGNNDVFRHDNLSSGDSTLIRNLTKIWQPFGLNLDSDPIFANGGYYIRDINDNVAIISLNTMWFYTFNKLTNDCSDIYSAGFKMLEWFDATLTELERANKRAYVIGHIPPNSERNEKAYKEACHNQYLSLVAKHNDTIISHFHGHTNQDSLSFLSTNRSDFSSGQYSLNVITVSRDIATMAPLDPRDPSIDVVHVFTNGPSVIPLYNPALRVYKYNNSGDLLDYTQFWTDLEKDNSDGFVTWMTEYTAAGAYNMSRLSTEEWCFNFHVCKFMALAVINSVNFEGKRLNNWKGFEVGEVLTLGNLFVYVTLQ